MSKSSEDGISLVSTLILLALLSSILVTFIYRNRTTIQETSNRAQLVQARTHANTIQELAVFGLQTNLLDPQTPARHERICRLENAKALLDIRDEAGKIDLNGTTDDILFNLIALYTENTDDARTVMDRILDYRDIDNRTRPFGAEAEDYAELGLEHGPKNGAFQLVDELHQIAGISTELVNALAPHLTVHSRRPTVATDYASYSVLAALSDEAGPLTEEELLSGSLAEWQGLRLQVPESRTVQSPKRNFTITSHILMDSGFAYAQRTTVALIGPSRLLTVLEKQRITFPALIARRIDEAPTSIMSCINLSSDVP